MKKKRYDGPKQNSKIKIVEVGPRDGLQNENTLFSISDKLKFIRQLILAGVNELEVTSFVSPKKIPQMEDAAELFLQVKQLTTSSSFKPIVLVPNLIGYDRAQEVGAKVVAILTATSEKFNLNNINATIGDSHRRIKEIAGRARADNVKMRGYISTVFGCPYQGNIALEKIRPGLDLLFNEGCYEVSLGDTIGIANPYQVEATIDFLGKYYDLKKIAMHFHDTRGLALTNIFISYQKGISIFDASAGGLGGCPYAKGATGNVATEDVLHLFKSIGVELGINERTLALAANDIFQQIGRISPSKYHNFLLKNEK